MQKARRQPHSEAEASALSLRPLVGAWFQVLFTRLPPSFSPCPHGTSSLSVTREYLALESGLPGFSLDFTCPAILGIPAGVIILSPTGLSPSVARLPRLFD